MMIQAGNGIVIAGLVNTNGAINLQISADTAILQSLQRAQSGSPHTAVSSSGSSTTYTASLNPTLSTYTQWMPITWVPDVSCFPGGATPVTLNIDNLGAVPIIERGGVPIVAADCPAATPIPLIYDGSSFRVM